MPSPDTRNPDAWKLVREALRPSSTAAAGAAAPYGFATRLAARYAALRREEKARLWARLSLQGALASVALTLAAVWLAPPPPEPAMLLVAPSLDLPPVR